MLTIFGNFYTAHGSLLQKAIKYREPIGLGLLASTCLSLGIFLGHQAIYNDNLCGLIGVVTALYAIIHLSDPDIVDYKETFGSPEGRFRIVNTGRFCLALPSLVLIGTGSWILLDVYRNIKEECEQESKRIIKR